MALHEFGDLGLEEMMEAAGLFEFVWFGGMMGWLDWFDLIEFFLTNFG